MGADDAPVSLNALHIGLFVPAIHPVRLPVGRDACGEHPS
jgi:hypothetical protein